MKFIEKVVPKNFNLFQCGDFHVGSALCHKSGIKELINMAQKDYDSVSTNFLVLHGDSIEAITPDDKRFNHTTATELSRPLAQSEAFVEMFKPIRHKIVTNLLGNHEMKLLRNHTNFAEWISDKLNVYYGTYTCVITYRTDVGEVLFKQFASHGFGSINSTADDPLRRETTMKLSLKKKLMEKAGDCELMTMGHVHRLMTVSPVNRLYLSSDYSSIKQNYTLNDTPKNGYIHPDNRHYACTGSFYKLYEDGISSYAEMAGYNPLELGFCIVKVRDGIINGIDRIILD